MSNITHYELTAIIDANIPDDEHSGIIEKMKKLISKNQGEITSEDNLGRKKLSYPIKKALKGVFICLEFDTEAKALKSIEKELKLNKDVIRYLIVKKPKNAKVITSESLDKDKKEKPVKKEEKKVVKEEKVEIKEETPVEDQKEEKVEIKEEKDKDNQKSNLNELDKKLDEILNDEIIN